MQLPDELLLSLVQLSILPGDFSTAAAACILGQSSSPTISAIILRHLYSLGLVDMSAGQHMWCLQGSVQAAAAELAVHLQLPLISAR